MVSWLTRIEKTVFLQTETVQKLSTVVITSYYNCTDQFDRVLLNIPKKFVLPQKDMNDKTFPSIKPTHNEI